MPDLFDIDSGALGIEAIWTLNGSLVLNDPAADAHVQLIKVTGLHALPDHEDPSAPKVGRIGEHLYPTSPGGKTAVVTGAMRAVSLPALRAFGRALMGELTRFSTTSYVDIAPHADLGGPAGRFYGRPLQLDPDDYQRLVSWSRDVVIGWRLHDPRVYFPSLAVDVTGSPAVVTNAGSAPADPVLTLAGAAGDITVSDGTHTLVFRNVPAGTLVIDFAARTAKVGAVNCELVVATSDWWDSFVDGIAGGATVSIAETGATSVRVQFTPAV